MNNFICSQMCMHKTDEFCVSMHQRAPYGTKKDLIVAPNECFCSSVCAIVKFAPCKDAPKGTTCRK